MTISKWQKSVDDWIIKYGVRYFNVTTNTLLLSEEVGEFSRLVARTYGEQSFKKSTSDTEAHNMIAEELADIIFVTTCLANQLEIDLTNQLKSNLIKKTQRDGQRHVKNKKINKNDHSKE